MEGDSHLTGCSESGTNHATIRTQCSVICRGRRLRADINNQIRNLFRGSESLEERRRACLFEKGLLECFERLTSRELVGPGKTAGAPQAARSSSLLQEQR